MEIPGIPDSIPRAHVINAIRELGIDPASVGRMELTAHVLYVTVYAEKDGRRFLASNAEPVKHVIAIPIEDQLDAAETGRSVVEAIQKYEGRGDPPEPHPA